MKSPRGWSLRGLETTFYRKDSLMQIVPRLNLLPQDVQHHPFPRRFWAFARKPDTGCWVWIGPNTGADGYAKYWIYPRYFNAAKIAWELHYRQPFPNDMDACHHCDNKLCIRPDHIFLGTAKD